MDMDGHGTIITWKRDQVDKNPKILNYPKLCLQHKSIIFGKLQKHVSKLCDENQTKIVYFLEHTQVELYKMDFALSLQGKTNDKTQLPGQPQNHLKKSLWFPSFFWNLEGPEFMFFGPAFTGL